ncbi:MAG: hypothetical protein ACLRFF_03360 [Alphaproteobacteria bacterium]|mgnify:FL=1
MGQLVSDVTKVLDYNNSKKEAKNQRQKILEQIASNENTKTNLIKKVLSEQRAKYGATGNSGTSLSEDAVLKRLRSETAQPYEEKKKTSLEQMKKIKVKKPNLLKTWLSKVDKIAG